MPMEHHVVATPHNLFVMKRDFVNKWSIERELYWVELHHIESNSSMVQIPHLTPS